MLNYPGAEIRRGGLQAMCSEQKKKEETNKQKSLVCSFTP